MLPDEIITEPHIPVKRAEIPKEVSKAKTSAKPAVKPVDTGGKQDVWEVEEIKKHRVDRHGGLQYRVKWKGYPASENTWEPEVNLKGSEDALKEYFESIGGEKEELKVRLEALAREVVRNRRLPLTQLKWKLRDLVGRTSPYNIQIRVRDGLQRDIGALTSFAQARDLIDRLLIEYETLFPSSRGAR